MLLNQDKTLVTASGIEVIRFGQKMRLTASKEIILSAGAIGSPQLLLLSGIGPEEHLQELDIPVVKELPGVGQNLQDHLMTGLTILSSNDQVWTGMNVFDSVNPFKYLNYLTSGRGPLATSGITVGGFLKSGTGNDSRPDIQMHTFPAHLTLDYDLAFRKSGNLADESYEGFYGHLKEG